MRSASRLEPDVPRWRTVLGYGAAASAWILATDLLADVYAPTSFLAVEVFKGWLFVLTTAVFLKVLIDRHVGRIRRSEHRCDSIIDCMADGVMLVDRDGDTIGANRAAVELFAVSDAAQLLKPF